VNVNVVYAVGVGRIETSTVEPVGWTAELEVVGVEPRRLAMIDSADCNCAFTAYRKFCKSDGKAEIPFSIFAMSCITTSPDALVEADLVAASEVAACR